VSEKLPPLSREEMEKIAKGHLKMSQETIKAMPEWLIMAMLPPTVAMGVEPEAEVSPPPPAERGLPSLETERLQQLLVERAKRKLSAIRLYEPFPSQAGFHSDMAKERLLRGSHRGGKTIPGAIELARAVLGLDPFNKYPRKNGRAYVVGKDEKHLGETLYPKLFKAGAFKIIKDPVTKQWRAFRPWSDEAIKHLAKPAPPIIPPTAIKSISWRKKNAGIPDKVVLNTGWEITFWTSLGKPPTGMELDIAWFDEEIVDPAWYPEMKFRLMDRAGRFYWTATPKAGTEQLLDLHERAAVQKSWKKPVTTEHFVHVKDNPFISSVEKEEVASVLSESDYQTRFEGEFVILKARIYPEWDERIHGVPYFDIPKTWTIYVVVDPGRQVCASLFLAVPGPDDEEAGRLFIFDELYIRNSNAQLFGEGMKRKLNNKNRQAYAFLIDRHGSKISDGGTGKSIMAYYSAALKKYDVKSMQTGHNFWLASDNPDADTEAARAWLISRDNEDPKQCGPVLSVITESCPNFCREIKKYRYPRVQGEIVEKIPHKGDVHLMDCLRYLAAHNPRWVPPPDNGAGGSWVLRYLEEKKKAAARGRFSHIRLGPGA
jgi:hypothetical protein